MSLGDDDDSLNGGPIGFQEEDSDHCPIGSQINHNELDSEQENSRPPKLAPVGDKVLRSNTYRNNGQIDWQGQFKMIRCP
jgi:hypothetical protein